MKFSEVTILRGSNLTFLVFFVNFIFYIDRKMTLKLKTQGYFFHVIFKVKI